MSRTFFHHYTRRVNRAPCQLHDLAASFAAIEPTFSGQSDDFERACSDFGMIFSVLSQIVIQLAISQQSAIGGDRRAAGPDHQAPVEIEPERAPIRSVRSL